MRNPRRRTVALLLAALLIGAALLAHAPVELPDPPFLQRAPGEPPASRVVDAVGRRVGLEDGPFRRVISLVPSATDLIVALGGSGRLVARTRYDSASAVRGLPSVGEPLRPNLERMMEIRPDLVIAWPRVRGRGGGARLDELGASVYFARSSSVGDVERLLRDLGPLLGRSAPADSLRRRLTCQLRQVSGAVAGRPERSAAYLVWPDPLYAAGSGSYLDSLIHLAGGRNVFAGTRSAWPEVSLEALVASDPEVVVLGSTGAGSAGWEALRNRPVWGTLEATEAGDVHEVPSDLFHRPGPRLGRAAAVLAALLHPDADLPDPAACGRAGAP